ncbi:MAG: signaling recognition particle receptor family protein [Candidatus Udaeobacter sp.]
MKFLERLAQQFAGKPIDWDELEESLIRADLGVPMTTRIIKTLQEREAWSLLGIGDVIKAVREEIARVLPPDPMPIHQAKGKPTVILIVGVNGTGKTTSTAKLAHYLIYTPNCRSSVSDARPSVPPRKSRASHREALQQDRQSVMLAAADTFRAAAIEQLDIWAKRLGVEMIRGQYGADPAALCYEAYQTATTREIDFLLCDTAGRQHTKANLMAELQKVKRALTKLDPDAPHETLLVVDATTGSNALSQARQFHSALTLTGVIVTKLDGSGKGGIVVAIQDELGIPTRFVGTGETIDDFVPFDAREYIDNLL